jgi:hypothetical protein
MDGVRADIPQPVGPGKMAGQRADTPATPPASEPAATQASQPATAPAVPREQIMPILKQLDAEAYQDREDAQKKLQDLGIGALQPLREILKSEKLSLEVVNRVKTVMWNLKATTRPALLSPQRPTEVGPMRGMRVESKGMAPDLPAQPTENPED